jgi:hypothetical protein
MGRRRRGAEEIGKAVSIRIGTEKCRVTAVRRNDFRLGADFRVGQPVACRVKKNRGCPG